MNDHKLKGWGWLLAPLYFFPVAAAWIACAAVGAVLTGWAAVRRQYWWSDMIRSDRDTPTAQYFSAFLRRWFQTTDNGACPSYFDTKNFKRPEWFNVWVWSGWRNAFGGNPWNMRNFPEDECLWASDDDSPLPLAYRFARDRANDDEREWYWLFTQSRHQPWKVGIHIVFPRKPTKEKPYRHLEVRHGFKFYPHLEVHDARFSVWDTGPRS